MAFTTRPTLSTQEDHRGARRAAVAEPAPAFLFRLLQCDDPLALPARSCLRGLDAVSLGRRSTPGAEQSDSARRLSLFVPDRLVSGAHAQLRRTTEGWLVEDAKSKNGTRVNGREVQQQLLADGDLVEVGKTFFLFRSALPAPQQTPPHLEASTLPAGLPGLVTVQPAFEAALDRLSTVAGSKLPLVLLGESGTGKEVVAAAAHALSKRRGAFQPVNCGALSATLLDAELFGYVKGAFTGAADDRPGLVRSSDRGTLFLDEIGELPPPAQAALLRVLQESEVKPVGTERAVKVDLRTVVATHRDLEAMVAAGTFRADLFARVSGFTLVLPPLRERREDFGLFVSALLRRHAPEPSRVTFEPEAARALFAYRWPLNVRELEKCLAAAVLLASGRPIGLSELPAAVTKIESKPGARRFQDQDDERRYHQIVALLEKERGNLSAVAREMGKARNQIQRWLKRYGIDADEYKG